ncbi:hypothetical protein M427DRAFT_57121 [Gonapodya prolifera JEL478]|uniref:Choline/ethanolaminephosphotransferase n=1 Tax=Gonapodya prolifera (strain JEL478) TaxID=1344416 RepID=A0A139ADZ0_GONPJ|nr:hypothetical protein M427DRAFT_57121 [Gonapodya prolifera JEL478]|eukprot:KXS14978.1 hypothetical protein M427DRAFT_57121 [Gonapodya prolifera JEL478]
MAILPSYISRDDAIRIKEHKYSGVDHSFLSKYVLGRYWNWLVEQVPLWVAPNLLTLSGFSLIVINFILMIIYVPDFDQPAPRWLYISTGLSLFAYQSLDAIDGKQARRTGSASPLGELFDHGCDALNTGIGGTLGLQAMGLGTSWWSIAVLSSLLSNFYCSTWETYHTGTLYLSPFSGPVEGLLSSIIAILVAGIFGQHIYTAPLCSIIPNAPCGVSANHIAGGMAIATSLYNIFAALYNVQRIIAPISKRSSPSAHPPPHSSAAHSTMTPSPVLTLLPLPCFLLLTALWTLATPSILSARLFVPFLAATSFTFGYHVGLMVLAHCCRAPFPLWNVLYTATWVGAGAAWGIACGAIPIPPGWSEEDIHAALVYAYLAASLLVYAHFAWDVIERLCEVFDIWCLRIKPKVGISQKVAQQAASPRKTGDRQGTPVKANGAPSSVLGTAYVGYPPSGWSSSPRKTANGVKRE